MALKASSTGQFMIPASPSAGTLCSSGAANTYTTTYVQMTAAAGAAVYVTGVGMTLSSASAPTYGAVQIATGSAGAEVIVGQVQASYNSFTATSTNAGTYVQLAPWIAVANSTRIAVKTADSVGALPHKITLQVIGQANVVDAGINESVDLQTIKTQTVTSAAAVTFPSSIHSSGAAVASVTGAVSSVTAAITLPSIPANWITAAGVSSNAIATQATGIASSVTAAVTLPSIPANWITAAGVSANAFAGLTVSSVTAAVTLPSIPGNWITAAGVSASAFNGKGDWNIGKTGYSLSSGQSIATVTGSVSSVTASVSLSAGQAVGSVTGAVSSVTAAVTVGSGTVTTVSGNVSGSVGSVTGLTASNLDTTVSSRMATFTYTAPDNSSVSAIKTQTDKLTYTVANQVNANIHSVNDITVTGSGTSGVPWGP